jgi:hypothetical protein
MQTDLGDGVWIDLSWCLWNALSGSAIFVLANGASGDNAFQQTRVANQAPTFTGSNRSTLGGRIRFTGAATLGAVGATASSRSSSSSSVSPAIVSLAQVLATIRYKQMGLR